MTQIGTSLKLHVRVRGKTRYHGKRTKNIIGGFPDRTVASGLKEMTINDHHLAVEILKRAQSKVAVLPQCSDPYRTLIYALDQGGSC